MDKATKNALKLADATLAALAAGDDYHEAMNDLEMALPVTKKVKRAVDVAERKFQRLSKRAYDLALAIKTRQM